MNAINSCEITNLYDADDNPTGGSVYGTGIKIDWQNGPLGRGETRVDPNGAFIETVLSACKQRLEFFNEGKYRCKTNALAILAIEVALNALEQRTVERAERKVEGTHQV